MPEVDVEIQRLAALYRAADELWAWGWYELADHVRESVAPRDE